MIKTSRILSGPFCRVRRYISQTSRLGHQFNIIGSHHSNSSPDEAYQPGQYIINKLFGYRGVILFSNPVIVKNNDEEAQSELKYCVLCDERDTADCESPFSRRQMAAGHRYDLIKHGPWFMNNVDYVSADEIIPYNAQIKDSRGAYHIPSSNIIQHRLYKDYIDNPFSTGPNGNIFCLLCIIL